MHKDMIQEKPKAFTLIELLIVVAIIAILAAIAVPNFLEAQTRSKISRTAADMRSIVTAIESYRVDNNKYFPAVPPGTTGPAALGLHQFWLRAEMPGGSVTGCGHYITTPIAYMTNVPYDVFNTIASLGIAQKASVMYGSSVDQPWVFLMQQPPIEVNITNSYYLYSVGPDNVQFGMPSAPIIAAYDASNGTVSLGDIVYAGNRWISGVK